MAQESVAAITTTSTDGVDVRALVEGDGPVIIIVHPGLDDGSMWKAVAARLADHFRVVRVHRRRYRLDLPVDAACTIVQEADDVRAVADSVGDPALLVGHSSGGVVALEAALAAPSLFAGAVLYDPVVATPDASWAGPVARARAALGAGRTAEAMRIFVRDIAGYPAWAAALAGMYVAARPRHRALAPRQIDDAAAVDRLGVRLDAYAHIAIPSLLLLGERSPAGIHARADLLARTLPHAELSVLRGQGHDANRRAPGAVAGAIGSFAGRVLA